MRQIMLKASTLRISLVPAPRQLDSSMVERRTPKRTVVQLCQLTNSSNTILWQLMMFIVYPEYATRETESRKSRNHEREYVICEIVQNQKSLEI